jgi:thymidylate kinase
MRWDKPVELGVRPSSGLLVAVEGTDGSGKTTLVRALTAALQARGLPVFATQQPTPSMRATDLFKLALHNDAPVADYRALYVFTTFANVLARGHAFEPWLREVCSQLPRPHLALWADAPPELAIARIRARPDDTNPLDPEYLARLHAAFAAMSRAGELVRLDTSGDASQPIAEALALIDGLLREHSGSK